jgi:hypothetical protein
MGKLIARVIGVDPGKATGVSVMDLKHSTQPNGIFHNFTVQPGLAFTHDEEGLASVVRILAQTVSEKLDAPLVIACEKYIVTRNSEQSQDIQPLRVTGLFKSIFEVLEIPHYYYEQMPSSAKMAFPNTRLASFGLVAKSMDRHAMDAARHSAFWCLEYANAKVDLDKDHLVDPVTASTNP